MNPASKNITVVLVKATPEREKLMRTLPREPRCIVDQQMASWREFKNALEQFPVGCIVIPFSPVLLDNLEFGSAEEIAKVIRVGPSMRRLSEKEAHDLFARVETIPFSESLIGSDLW